MRITTSVSLLASFGSAIAFALGSSQQPIGASAGPSTDHDAVAAPSYREHLLALHKSLIEISSTSGTEYDVGKHLLDYFESRSWKTQTQAIPPRENTAPGKQRFNVLAWPGASPQPQAKVLVTSHIDVVPPHIPYSISDEEPTSDTVIKGRGSVDAKGAVAAQIIAVEELLANESLDPEDVMLLFVVGEEVNGDGMRRFSASIDDFDPPLEFEAAIFGEPTENKLACGHKGHIICTVKAKGRAGHSGYPWLGKSATEVLMRGLVRVLDADLGSTARFGNTTANVGLLQGGVAANVIPEEASARVAVRVALGPQATGHEPVRRAMGDILASVDSEALSLDCENGYGAVDCNCDVDGFTNITVNYGTDVPNLKGSHTRYLYGPGDILVAHSDHEQLTVADLETAVEGYKALIQHALKA
ncbi:Acetylornithine deacetylase [Pleurostoma richardsiae]|uniref:Acetylornithine deacetylase n=1 Tax=Pleurostoma richardsiae TaxID=41990 RepID=A0AA38VBP8_9PEZI|nr:Acetylornithine deacetylase [Pleurostoma richardsiae]